MIGLIGLGQMGGAMARRLVEQGQVPRVWDSHGPARDRAAGQVVDGPAACAAPVVILSLPDAGAVAAVLAALLPAMPPGGVVVDTSTLDPLAAREVAARAAYLDAPVSGGPAGAAAGTLTMMLGGEAAALERARPALSLLASRIIHVGGAGAGQAAKLVNNLLVATHLAAAGEAMRLGAAAGVGPEALLAVVNAASGRSAATEVNWPRWVLNGAFDSGFTAGLMRKDVRLAMALAEATGTPLATCAAAASAWAASDIADAEDFNRVSARIGGIA